MRNVNFPGELTDVLEGGLEFETDEFDPGEIRKRIDSYTEAGLDDIAKKLQEKVSRLERRARASEYKYIVIDSTHIRNFLVRKAKAFNRQELNKRADELIEKVKERSHKKKEPEKLDTGGAPKRLNRLAELQKTLSLVEAIKVLEEETLVDRREVGLPRPDPEEARFPNGGLVSWGGRMSRSVLPRGREDEEGETDAFFLDSLSKAEVYIGSDKSKFLYANANRLSVPDRSEFVTMLRSINYTIDLGEFGFGWIPVGEDERNKRNELRTLTIPTLYNRFHNEVGAFTWEEVPLSTYDKVPPDHIVDKIREHRSRELFDYMTVASVKNVPDPIIFGRFYGSEERFFIAQYDTDVSIDDLI